MTTGGSYLGFEQTPEWLIPSSVTGRWEVGDIYESRLGNDWNGYKVPFEYIVIGGGGGSAGSRDDVQVSGGGGAGGYRSSVFNELSGGLSPREPELLALPGDSFSVSVGAGGTAGTAAGDGAWGGLGTNGASSTFGTITSDGGGRGGTGQSTGLAAVGGSGGGGGISNKPGFDGTSSQGFAGGPGAEYGLMNSTGVYGGTGGGGGGGAGGAGQPGLSVGNPTITNPKRGQLIGTPVAVATTENINRSSPPATIDGVTLTDGMRVLIKNQNTTTQNGIFTYNSAANTLTTRAIDMDQNAEIDPGTRVTVTGGTVNAGTVWGIETRMTTNDGVLGTTPIVWVQDLPAPPKGGNGGVGIVSNITGSAVGRAGGGGGGTTGGPFTPIAGSTFTAGAGVGVHGGATSLGSTGNSSVGAGYAATGSGLVANRAGVAGSANTGGGAAGSCFLQDGSGGVAGGAGGSGVVFVRYPNEFGNLTVSAGLTIDNGAGGNIVGSGIALSPSFNANGYKVYMFKAGSGTVTFNG